MSDGDDRETAHDPAHERLLAEAARDRFVARATQILFTSLDLDETLRTVAALAVPVFADWAAVDRFEADGSCERVAVYHADPRKRRLAYELFERFGPSPAEVQAFRAAAAPLHIEHLDDATLAALAKSDEHLRITRELELRSFLTVPLRARSGDVTGGISFIYAESGRRYGSDDVPMAEDLARSASVAIENAELYTALRREQRERARAAERLERITHSTPDLLYVFSIRDGSNLYLNREVHRSLGYPNGHGPPLAGLLHPDDSPALSDALQRIAAAPDGALVVQSARLRHASGDWRWFDLRATVFARDDAGPSQILVVARDVTAERERAEALARSEERFRLATEALRGLVYDWDWTTGRLTHSRGLHDLVGFEPDASRDAAWWHGRVHPDDLPAAHAALRDALATGAGTFRCAYRVRHRDGRWRWVDDSGRLVVDAAGRPLRLVGCTLDITERVEAQDALRLADRRKDEFLAVLSHELRNPLASIRNAAEILSFSSSAEPRLARASDVIARQVSHMARLLEDLLDVSRIATGKLSLRPVPIDVTALVRQVCQDVGPSVQHAGLSLVLDLPLEGLWVAGDAVRLSQVLSNLLSNAVKYTDRGRSVTVRARGDREVVVEVADEGIGIEPALLAQLFVPFVQSAQVGERAAGGLGLGLALVRGLVELHGGAVEVHSEGAGRGATFRVRLPRTEARATAPAPAPQPAGPLRVLVVEDNVDGAEMLRMLLELSGHAVAVAHDGASALAEAARFGPDLVLCDIGLPGGMDGYAVARALRAAGPAPYLVAVTGWGQPADVERAAAAGFDRHLTKPIEPAALQALIARAR